MGARGTILSHVNPVFKIKAGTLNYEYTIHPQYQQSSFKNSSVVLLILQMLKLRGDEESLFPCAPIASRTLFKRSKKLDKGIT